MFQKLTQDHLVSTYSIYGFFPQAYELVYGEGQPPDIAFNGRTRGQIAIIQDGDMGLVIKPLQNQREDEIARIAGGLEVGPHQFLSLPGFLTEEFVAGHFFTELSTERVTADSMFQVGQDLGRKLTGLHQRQVYYNDATLSDPSGRSHLRVLPDNSCRLIDFGVSLLLDRHPQVTMEETYNFVRTLPVFQMFSRMGAADKDVVEFLKQYRQSLASMTREEIMARDLRFTEEGLALAAQRLGEDIAGPFREGFLKQYGES